MPTRADDLAELSAANIKALNEALRDGESRYPAGSWKRATEEEHREHLYHHILCLVHGFEPGEDHLTHIICRANALYVLSGRAK